MPAGEAGLLLEAVAERDDRDPLGPLGQRPRRLVPADVEVGENLAAGRQRDEAHGLAADAELRPLGVADVAGGVRRAQDGDLAAREQRARRRGVADGDAAPGDERCASKPCRRSRPALPVPATAAGAACASAVGGLSPTATIVFATRLCATAGRRARAARRSSGCGRARRTRGSAATPATCAPSRRR